MMGGCERAERAPFSVRGRGKQNRPASWKTYMCNGGSSAEARLQTVPIGNSYVDSIGIWQEFWDRVA